MRSPSYTGTSELSEGTFFRHFGDGDLLIEGDVALQGEQQRHHLGGAGGIHAHQRILVKQHVAGLRVDEYSGLGVQMIGRKRAGVIFIPVRRRGKGLRSKAGKQCEQNKKERDRPATHGKFSFEAVFRRTAPADGYIIPLARRICTVLCKILTFTSQHLNCSGQSYIIMMTKP